MKGPIYFGGLTVSGHCEDSAYSVDKKELEKEMLENWHQEVKTVLKFIEDTKLDMPLMKRILSSSQAMVTIQEYGEKSA